jgi:hypothetical protein
MVSVSTDLLFGAARDYLTWKLILQKTTIEI